MDDELSEAVRKMAEKMSGSVFGDIVRDAKKPVPLVSDQVMRKQFAILAAPNIYLDHFPRTPLPKPTRRQRLTYRLRDWHNRIALAWDVLRDRHECQGDDW